MAEAEELLTDAARHATVFAQNLWRRHRAPQLPATLQLSDVAARLDLLTSAVFGESFPLRSAQSPAPATLLGIVFRHDRKPRTCLALPATDGRSVWLPTELGIADAGLAMQLYRAMALQQVLRARRGSARLLHPGLSPLLRDVYLVLEARASEAALSRMLPGLATASNQLRHWALRHRPPLEKFPACRQALERWLRQLMSASRIDEDVNLAEPEDSMRRARVLIRELGLLPSGLKEKHLGPHPLYKDWWTGELRLAESGAKVSGKIIGEDAGAQEGDTDPGRSSRLRRRPDVRDPKEGEDEEGDENSPWMIQLDEPHQHAEDPMGLQRPVDRDEETSADHFGDLASELPEARLVSTPGKP